VSESQAVEVIGDDESVVERRQTGQHQPATGGAAGDDRTRRGVDLHRRQASDVSPRRIRKVTFMASELNLNEDPDVRETGGLPRLDEVGGSADEADDRLADSFGSLDVGTDDDVEADAP
jgi:hypothetical protein